MDDGKGEIAEEGATELRRPYIDEARAPGEREGKRVCTGVDGRHA